MANELILSREACQAIADRARRMVRGPGTTWVAVGSRWLGDVRWGRNRVMVAGDVRDIVVRVRRMHRGAQGMAETSRLDDEGLGTAVRSATAAMHQEDASGTGDYPPPSFTYAKPKNWSDATVGLTSAARGELVRSLIKPAEAAGLWSAGYLAVSAFTEAFFGAEGESGYCARTSA
ncbi:MAG: hypothetical protein ACREL3_13775, partial [Gemmatimonadales bacterium]